jgi:hypothetical protein
MYFIYFVIFLFCWIRSEMKVLLSIPMTSYYNDICTTEVATVPYPEPDKSSPVNHTLLHYIYLNILLPLTSATPD